jgi:hypothetical protein
MQDPDLNLRNLKTRIANALGLDVAGLLKTEQDLAMEQAKNMIASGGDALAQNLGAGAGAQATASPEAMQSAMDMAGVQPAPLG